MKLFADARESGPITSIGAYCLSTPNSTGTPTTLDAFGSSIATANNVTLTAGSMPLESFGFFITSTTPGFVPVASGVLCVQGAIGRFVAPGQIKNSGQLGEISLSTTAGEWSTASIPTPVGSYAAMAGQTTYFQAWHREPSGGSSNSHFSHGLGLVWQ